MCNLSLGYNPQLRAVDRLELGIPNQLARSLTARDDSLMTSLQASGFQQDMFFQNPIMPGPVKAYSYPFDHCNPLAVNMATASEPIALRTRGQRSARYVPAIASWELIATSSPRHQRCTDLPDRYV